MADTQVSKLGIVILNYLNYKDTIECVHSILKQTYTDYQIVIVDNNSANESYKILSSRFKNHSNIHLIQNNTNIGFARGNNTGISYLRNLHINKIFVINNDTFFDDSSYLQKLISLKYKPCIGMVGTAIINADGINHNPQPVMYADHRSVNDVIGLFFLRARRKLVKLGINLHYVDKLQHHVTSRILRPHREMLHGAAILFTEHFFEHYKGFYPGTFLFMEEDILALLCQRTEMRQLYVPSLSMNHKEDGSSNIAWHGKDQDLIKENYSNDSLKKFRYLQNLTEKSLRKEF
jgi:GT2 family glycosyltransferase